MKVPEHIAASYLLEQIAVHNAYGPWGTVLMIFAGCLPDLDGLTVIAGWRSYRTYHRILASLSPEVASRYGHAETGPLASAAMQQQLHDAVSGGNWELAVQLSTRLAKEPRSEAG